MRFAARSASESLQSRGSAVTGCCTLTAMPIDRGYDPGYTDCDWCKHRCEERFDDVMDMYSLDWCEARADGIGHLCDACDFRERPPHYDYVKMIFNNTKLGEAPDVANRIACFAYLVCYRDSQSLPFPSPHSTVDPHRTEP